MSFFVTRGKELPDISSDINSSAIISRFAELSCKGCAELSSTESESLRDSTSTCTNSISSSSPTPSPRSIHLDLVGLHTKDFSFGSSNDICHTYDDETRPSAWKSLLIGDNVIVEEEYSQKLAVSLSF